MSDRFTPGPFESAAVDQLAVIEVGPGCRRIDLPSSPGLRAWIVDMDPGAVWPQVDDHPTGEGVFVVRGELIEGDQRLPAGTWIDFKPLSRHQPRTDTGVRLFGFNPLK